MYHNLTDRELTNLHPNTELEAELMKRLDGSTLQDWDDLKEREQKWYRKARDEEEFSEKVREALKKVATEIHRCAEFGTIEINPEFRARCEEVVCFMDEYIAYEYPKLFKQKNSSSFRAGGEA